MADPSAGNGTLSVSSMFPMLKWIAEAKVLEAVLL